MSARAEFDLPKSPPEIASAPICNSLRLFIAPPMDSLRLRRFEVFRVSYYRLVLEEHMARCSSWFLLVVLAWIPANAEAQYSCESGNYPFVREICTAQHRAGNAEQLGTPTFRYRHPGAVQRLTVRPSEGV